MVVDRCITLLLLMLACTWVQAQDVLGQYAERLEAFGRTVPQEKVYVHMDNTSYYQGDTIWFAAYTRQTNTDMPSGVSGVLYVELLNHDGYLVERKLVEMREGRGNGFFALNSPILYSGFYELRAYTRWQLNWGEHEREHYASQAFLFRDKKMEREYFRDYDKLYSRVFPVYDRPNSPGDYTRDMTLRVLRREFKHDSEDRELKVSLFPEGGNLVAGVPCRVAFEAAMSDGEQVEGTLSVISASSNGSPACDSVRTVNRGRGTFMVIPQTEKEQDILFTSKDGRTVKTKLPKAEKTGVALRLEKAKDVWQTKLLKTSDLSADSLAISLMYEGRLVDWQRFASLGGTDADRIYSIRDSLLPESGIYQLSVFDAQGHLYADRLFFVRKSDGLSPTLVLSELKEKYDPLEKIDLTIRGPKNKAAISLAVCETKSSDRLFDNGSILTEMLLCSELKGFIPDPGWYFEKDDIAHQQALDLLMMTQGWRRFSWKDMSVKGSWELSQPNEITPVYTGHVYFNPNRQSFNLSEETLRDYRHLYGYAKKSLTSSMRIHAELIHVPSRASAVSDEHLKGNSFKMPCPRFYGNSILFLSVADTAKWSNRKMQYSWVQQLGYGKGIPFSIKRKMYLGEADFKPYISWPYPRFVNPYNFYQKHLRPQADAADYDIPLELLADPSVTTMQSITITAHRRSRLKSFDASCPVMIADAYDVWNTIEDAGVPLIDSSDFGTPFVCVYLNNYGSPDLKDGNGDSRIRYEMADMAHLRFSEVPADSIYYPKYLRIAQASSTFLKDNEAMHDTIMAEDPREKVDKFVIYSDYQPRLDGGSRYRGADRPETRIVEYGYLDGSKRPIFRDRFYTLPGFAEPAEFYHPDYSKHKLSEGRKDYRRTLYWNPNLQLDENGEAKVTFYNNSRTTSLSVEAEGQAADGTLLWSR